MPTPQQLRSAQLYADILEEIKVRTAAIDAGTGGRLPALPEPIIREHCFLQLRMICELIALGCLVAHGGIDGAELPRLQKQWAADKIIEELEKLNPHFYPQAARLEPDENGNPAVNAFHPPPFSKADLLDTYYKCGNYILKNG